ncbi:hypothetical protein AB0J71_44530 [Nonomuraea sp. NPDC049637]|uniref:hypothetical protein n=1 Tax=Nonomuraea sp. NPDC049637 TaxID=3154356 RepID=UPI00341C9FE6
MASTPAGSWPVTETTGEAPGDTAGGMAGDMADDMAGETAAGTAGEAFAPMADCLGGAVHLACAESPRDELAVIVAGFAGYEAQSRARALARLAALRRLRRLTGDGPQPAWTGTELRLSDFVADPPASLRRHVPGTGLLSGRRYRLPVEVVWTGGHECLVEPATSGVVDSGVPEAIAEVVAHDVVARWWAEPREPLLRVSGSLDRLLPPGVTAAASGLGLRMSAFVLSVPDLRVALVTVGGEGATLAAAAGRTVKSAVCEAFLRAMAARAQPWSTLELPDCLRRFAVWQREGDYAAHLERLAVDADPRLVDEVSGLRPSGWPEIAARRFGHEPVAVRAGGEVVKVLCPGAACYRAAPGATVLPCPVP